MYCLAAALGMDPSLVHRLLRLLPRAGVTAYSKLGPHFDHTKPITSMLPPGLVSRAINVALLVRCLVACEHSKGGMAGQLCAWRPAISGGWQAGLGARRDKPDKEIPCTSLVQRKNPSDAACWTPGMLLSH